MAAPTSDERREVAEKLRQASHTDANLDLTIAIAILDTIGEVHRPIAAVVADLIDPTCHIEDDDWASKQCMGPMLSCDRCGNAFPEINGPHQYCPCCGARVVTRDGDE